MTGQIEVYEYVGEVGSRYIKIMVADPAGAAKDTEKAVFYQCEETGAAFWRWKTDFDARMRFVGFKES